MDRIVVRCSSIKEALRDLIARTGVVVALAAVAGCGPSLERSAYEERRFATVGVPKVTLTTLGGDIEIRGWSRSEVVVELEKRGAAAAVGALSLTATQRDGTIAVDVARPASSRWRRRFTGAASADLVVTMPYESDVEAHTGQGAITVERVEGRIDLRTEDGGIRGTEVRGDIRARSEGGIVRLDRIEGRVDAATQEGEISVAGVLDVVEVHAARGPVTVELEVGRRLQGDWTITTGVGDITVRLPDDLRAEIEATAPRGGIGGDRALGGIDLRTFGRHRLHVMPPGAEHKIHVRSAEGDIRFTFP